MLNKITREDFCMYAVFSDELLLLESSIIAHSKQICNKSNHIAKCTWYKKFKKEVVALIGCSSKNPKLKSAQAYTIVYGYLYNLLFN